MGTEFAYESTYMYIDVMYNMEGQFGYSIYAERGELGGITTRKEHKKMERIVTFLGVDSSHSVQRSGFFFFSPLP